MLINDSHVIIVLVYACTRTLIEVQLQEHAYRGLLQPMPIVDLANNNIASA